MFVSWYFPRSTTSVHLKRKGKAVPSTSPVSSQYLGSLKMLEDKCVQNISPEFNKVDNLRAAVYQVDLKNEQTKPTKKIVHIKVLIQDSRPHFFLQSVFFTISLLLTYRYSNPFILLAMPFPHIMNKKLNERDVMLLCGLYFIVSDYFQTHIFHYFYFTLNISECLLTVLWLFPWYVLFKWHSGKVITNLVLFPEE